jgi:hypothetical protein
MPLHMCVRLLTFAALTAVNLNLAGQCGYMSVTVKNAAVLVV